MQLLPAFRILGQPRRGELADRLEHPVALLAVSVCASPNEALVEQRGERVEIRIAHRLCGLERGAPAKDGERGKELLFTLGEQIVRPGDRRAQGRMTRIRVTRRRKIQPFGEPLE